MAGTRRTGIGLGLELVGGAATLVKLGLQQVPIAVAKLKSAIRERLHIAIPLARARFPRE